MASWSTTAGPQRLLNLMHRNHRRPRGEPATDKQRALLEKLSAALEIDCKDIHSLSCADAGRLIDMAIAEYGMRGLNERTANIKASSQQLNLVKRISTALSIPEPDMATMTMFHARVWIAQRIRQARRSTGWLHMPETTTVSANLET
jgi:hypothetical protein